MESVLQAMECEKVESKRKPDNARVDRAMDMVRHPGNRKAGEQHRVMADLQTDEREDRAPGENRERFDSQQRRKQPEAAREKARQRLAEIEEIQDQVMLMYAQGLGAKEISNAIENRYDLYMTKKKVLNIVEDVPTQRKIWQNRELRHVYAFVFVDELPVKIQADKKKGIKKVYSLRGISLEGDKEILGIWLAEKGTAAHWKAILAQLRDRGVESILVLCCEDCPELNGAVSGIFPEALLQHSLMELQRASLGRLPVEHFMEFCRDAQAVYSVASAKEAQEALSALRKRWKQPPDWARRWLGNSGDIEKWFEAPAATRRMIHSVNLFDGFHTTLSKVTRGGQSFSHEEAALTALYWRVLEWRASTLPVGEGVWEDTKKWLPDES